jgi:hypothetical protein
MVNICRHFNHKWEDKEFNSDGFPTYRECTRKGCDCAQEYYPITAWHNCKKKTVISSGNLFTMRNHTS